MLIDVALWIILAAAIVIVPVGCILTRQEGETHLPPGH